MGHTHEDVDQLFSRIAQRLACTGAETIPNISVYLKRWANHHSMTGQKMVNYISTIAIAFALKTMNDRIGTQST